MVVIEVPCWLLVVVVDGEQGAVVVVGKGVDREQSRPQYHLSPFVYSC